MALAVFGFIIFIFSFVLKGLNKQTPEHVNMNAYAWTARVVGVLMIVGGLLVASVVIVPSGNRAVLLRFGAAFGDLTEGIHLITPGMDSTVLMETRTQKEESKATAASRDLQTVTTSLALNFHVDPSRIASIYRNVGTEYNSRIIDPAVQESLKTVTAKYTAEELIKNRSQVKSEVEQDITARLKAYDIIVEPAGLSITNFDFSPEFNRAIEAKQVAQQEAEKQKYVLQQAELQKQTDVTKAEGTAQAAKLNAESLKVQGGALVIAREWIEKWDGKLPSVSASGGGGMIFDLSTLMKEGFAEGPSSPAPRGH
ncbi:MAG TPA: prohibitin family protein [Fimbriimonadaceae bacterium]|nr:prohibitin family protein [Fimbriimonadaceae bacterium]